MSTEDIEAAVSRRMPKGVREGMIRVSGKDYLPVPFRLLWMRIDQPLWGIHTEILEAAGYTVVRATVTDEMGRTIASAHKAITAGGKFPPIEKAETGAMGRALGAAGFGTQFGELDEEEPGVMGGIADSPVSRGNRPSNIDRDGNDTSYKAPATLADAKAAVRQAAAAIYPAMASNVDAPLKMLTKMVGCINQSGEPLEDIVQSLPHWVYAHYILHTFKARCPEATPAFIFEAMKEKYKTDRPMTEWTDEMWKGLFAETADVG